MNTKPIPAINDFPSVLPLSSIISILENSSGNLPPIFSKLSGEEKYIKAQQFLRRELESCINDGRLVPVNILDISAAEEAQIILVMKPDGDSHSGIQV